MTTKGTSADSSNRYENPYNFNGSSFRYSLSPLRQRPRGQSSTIVDLSTNPKNRRGSAVSDSVDNTKYSFISSTDDLLLPRAKDNGVEMHGEYSHWHSAPLALALLPAVGGLLFQNGSAVVTDLTLLCLAAIFLNWSVRLPWNWYHSAHSTTPLSSLSSDHLFSNKVITEEGNDDKQKTDSKTTGQLPREHTAERSSSSQPLTSAEASSADIAASSELRVHELFALTACFLGPISGAWLLHTIRSQLSRPSEGLVSNYNLTIFLLAAELRPLSHLLKMIQARTLHLQRSLNHSCFTTQFPNGLLSPSIHEISSRLDDLEAYIATFSNKSPTNTKASPELVNSIRKTLQPELDTVTHAIHRYEKHSAVTTLQTQSRLQDLEARLADAITLAAAAERVHHPSSLAGRPGRFTFTFSALVEGVCAVTILPLQIASWIVLLPPRTLRKMKRWMKNKVRKEMRTAGRDKVKVEVLRSDDGGRSRLKEQTSLRGPGNRAKKFM